MEESSNRNLESKIYFEKLPDETVKNILVLATMTTRQTPETYHSPVQTCKRFSTNLERIKPKIFPRIYLQLLDDEIKQLPCMCGKLEEVFKKS